MHWSKLSLHQNWWIPIPVLFCLLAIVPSISSLKATSFSIIEQGMDDMYGFTRIFNWRFLSPNFPNSYQLFYCLLFTFCNAPISSSFFMKGIQFYGTLCFSVIWVIERPKICPYTSFLAPAHYFFSWNLLLIYGLLMILLHQVFITFPIGNSSLTFPSLLYFKI